MKKIMLFFAATCLFFAAKAQIPNGNFEQLNADGSLKNWGSTFLFSVAIDSTGQIMDSLIFDNDYFYAPTTDAYSGSYALLLSNAQHSLTGETVAGRASADEDSIFTAWGAADFVPIQAKPQSLAFYYKFLPVNNDSASVRLEMYDVYGDLVGQGTQIIWGAQNDYTYLDIPINYVNAAIPDSLIANYSILFNNFYSVTPATRHASMGTRFWVDEVNLKTSANSANETKNTIFSLKVYPNPTAHQLTIDYPNEIQSLSLQDVAGKTTQLSPSNRTISLENLPNGVYFLHVQTLQGKISKKIVKTE